MITNHTSKSSPTELPPELSESHWTSSLWLVIGSVAIVLLLQIGSAASVSTTAKELRSLLSEAHVAVNTLEQRIGYGGLIHNFKNYVLRPEEEHYREAAYLDAAHALALLEILRTSADNIDIDASLSNTHEMLEGYTLRLTKVHQLAESGLSSQSIDEQVRFDDNPALQEVDVLLSLLNTAVQDRLEKLQRQGSLTSLLSTVGTALLGLLLITIVARRQKKHAAALGTFAEHLAATNVNLSKANESLSQFAGIVSHDLKSPIRYINMFNQLIIEDKKNNKAVEQHTGHIDIQVQKMDSIIDSLLDFTKAGFSKPKIHRLDITRLFADIEQSLKPEIARHKAHVEFHTNLETPVLADPKLLARVINSLIDNSFKYHNPEELIHIVVSANRKDAKALFSVTDNGIGIDARFADIIFEPMARLHGEKSPYEGVGIGLSLAKTIVESHGGLIWLDSDVSSGACISFSLSLSQQSREAA
ncbi:sensor histidine kinase [Granulosicoccus antarcticus]|uniref:histidine kinase n=1 Tax=Granulosicoccus antarcticus IMCC3135 TaxID=1192854 RepID=A0A2Z2NZ83_9GAMM|nr:ATP-binding protein [Granulosicoccus antarcticus]ASJ73107.1 Phytochrome-like protein cph1 [Granulosicoccus antarcticus IMCC3135]